jgi:hypothetical protein
MESGAYALRDLNGNTIATGTVHSPRDTVTGVGEGYLVVAGMQAPPRIFSMHSGDPIPVPEGISAHRLLHAGSYDAYSRLYTVSDTVFCRQDGVVIPPAELRALSGTEQAALRGNSFVRLCRFNPITAAWDFMRVSYHPQDAAALPGGTYLIPARTAMIVGEKSNARLMNMPKDVGAWRERHAANAKKRVYITPDQLSPLSRHELRGEALANMHPKMLQVDEGQEPVPAVRGSAPGGDYFVNADGILLDGPLPDPEHTETASKPSFTKRIWTPHHLLYVTEHGELLIYAHDE